MSTFEPTARRPPEPPPCLVTEAVAPSATPPVPEAVAQSPVPQHLAQGTVEIVPRGVLWALAAIPLGMLVAVVLWKLGFIASISSFLIAGVAVFLYTKGAGTVPKRGIAALVGVIVVGVVLSFLAIVAADLVEYYNTPDGQALGYPSALQFVTSNLFNVELIKSYGSDLVMFVVFAALGVFGTMRRLLAARRA